MTHSDVILE